MGTSSVTWKSSNTSIVTVSNLGVVTAKAAGSATITVTTVDGNKTATCKITVTKKDEELIATSIVLNRNELDFHLPIIFFIVFSFSLKLYLFSL